MFDEKKVQKELSSYVSSLLQSHFGKGPASIEVSVCSPYIVVHLKGFLAPTEEILYKQNKFQRILETRDLLMDELKPRIKFEFLKSLELDVKELYADWDLHKKTGIILVVLNTEAPEVQAPQPSGIDEGELHQRIADFSIDAQKEPAGIETCFLNDHLLVIRRTGILMKIEKELIRNGFSETLKLSKRVLESNLIFHANFESALKQKVSEIFVDWNFKDDIGYSVLLLEPAN